MSLKPGDLVSAKYRIVRLIGDGGMGSVYEARHELLGAAVALKFLHTDLARRPGLAARFLQEARVSATIASPHVTRVTDVDTAPDGSPYLVMELLSGESLQAYLDRNGKLSPALAIDFALQTLAGLEAAHALNVVHRDLKPDNVFVTHTASGPLLKLIDFGIAKLRESSEYKKGLTRAGVVMGTPEYMAPEQLFAANEVDHRADIYSLGVMLFEMLSGRRPADAPEPEALIAKVISRNVEHLGELEPSLPPGLVQLVERALEPERDLRFASAYEMRVQLAPFAGELSHAARLAATAAPLPNQTSAIAPIEAGRTSFEPQVFSRVDAPGLPDTEDAPRLSGVPKTLPPEGPVVRASSGTQAAAPPSPAAWQSMPAPTPPPAAPLRGPKKRGSWLWLWVLAGLALVVVGGVVGAQAFMSERRKVPELPSFDAGLSPATPASIEPIVTLPGGEQASPFPTAETPRPTGTTPRPRVEPGTGSGGAAPTGTSTGTPLPFPSFTLPTSLPPLPSGFPTTLPTAFPTALPSGFPQIPGLTVPRTTAPTASGAPAGPAPGSP